MTLCDRIVDFSLRITRSGILGNICENGLSAGSYGNGQDEAYFRLGHFRLQKHMVNSVYFSMCQVMISNIIIEL